MDTLEHLDALIADCRTCAETYETSPGLAGAGAIIDLYRGIERLASLVKQVERSRKVGF